MLNAVQANIQNNWPTYRSMLWRLLRTSVATAFAETMYFACGDLFSQGQVVECAVNAYNQWSDPKTAAQGLAVAFVSGLLVALSKGIRNTWGRKDESKGLIHKLPV